MGNQEGPDVWWSGTGCSAKIDHDSQGTPQTSSSLSDRKEEKTARKSYSSSLAPITVSRERSDQPETAVPGIFEILGDPAPGRGYLACRHAEVDIGPSP